MVAWTVMHLSRFLRAAMPARDDSQSPEQPDQLVDILRLCMVGGVGPRLRMRLLERFGSYRAVLQAGRSELEAVPGVGPKLAERIAAAHQEVNVQAEIELCQRHGIRILAGDSPEYPRLLREIVDPPGVLFVRGELQPQDGLAVAMVGTRHATPYGLRQAERLAAGLARAGLTIVSGLARGIDAAAHRGALAAGGRTLAVLAGGVLNIFPPEHCGLAEQVAAQGALLSEAPAGMAESLRGLFPQRNRLISGLSLGVIVVEAPERSGALITARHAMEQGREVFAVPGSIESRTSRGCHRLIQDGARLVQSVDDVLEELGPLVEGVARPQGEPIRHPAELQLNDQEQRVLAAVETEPTPIDQVVARSGLPVARVLSTLSVLEMRRLVRRVSGTAVVRV